MKHRCIMQHPRGSRKLITLYRSRCIVYKAHSYNTYVYTSRQFRFRPRDTRARITELNHPRAEYSKRTPCHREIEFDARAASIVIELTKMRGTWQNAPSIIPILDRPGGCISVFSFSSLVDPCSPVWRALARGSSLFERIFAPVAELGLSFAVDLFLEYFIIGWLMEERFEFEF